MSRHERCNLHPAGSKRNRIPLAHLHTKFDSCSFVLLFDFVSLGLATVRLPSVSVTVRCGGASPFLLRPGPRLRAPRRSLGELCLWLCAVRLLPCLTRAPGRRDGVPPGRPTPRRDATERAGGKYGPGRILRGIMYYSRSGQRAGRGLGPNRITQNNVFLHSLPPRTRLATSTLSRSASLKLRYPGLTRINLA